MKKKIRYLFAAELQRIAKWDYIMLYLFYRFISRVDEFQILMLSESREELSGNLKFIDDKIDKDKFRVIYFFKRSILLKSSFQEKKELCKYLAKSKYILVDDFIPFMYPIPLRKETKFIQVWHAMGAFKTVGFSRLGKVGGPSPRSLTHRNYTDTIVSSESIRENYAEAFKMDISHVHAIGIPRTDVFFDDAYKIKIRNQFYSVYPKLKGKKIVLFAPTFRGNGIKTAYYDFSWLSFDKIEEELKEEYVFLIKMHPFIKDKALIREENEFYIDLSDEREINDLLFVADVLVTDYSSVIFEAALLNLKTVFFVPDMEEYVSTRDFYYRFEDYAFGNIAKTDDELVEAICRGNNDEKKLQKFKDRFCDACDGKSSERFVEYFFENKKEE